MAVLVAAPAPSDGAPDDATLAELQALYDDARTLTVHARLARFGDPFRWRSPAACVLAGRTMRLLGGRKAGAALILRGHRLARGRDLDVAVHHVLEVLDRRGPLRAWELLESLPGDEGAPAVTRAQVALARATVATTLRDFAVAGAELDRAEALCPDHRHIPVDRAQWLAAQDRLEEALAVARGVLARRPRERLAIQIAAGLLAELGRLDEARTLLDDATAHGDAPVYLLQRAALEGAAECHAEAWRCVQQAIPLLPCLDEATFRGLAGLCAHAAYFAGDPGAAARFARAARQPVLDRLAPAGSTRTHRRDAWCCRCPTSARTTSPADPRRWPPSRSTTGSPRRTSTSSRRSASTARRRPASAAGPRSTASSCASSPSTGTRRSR